MAKKRQRASFPTNRIQARIKFIIFLMREERGPNKSVLFMLFFMLLLLLFFSNKSLSCSWFCDYAFGRSFHKVKLKNLKRKTSFRNKNLWLMRFKKQTYILEPSEKVWHEAIASEKVSHGAFFITNAPMCTRFQLHSNQLHFFLQKFAREYHRSRPQMETDGASFFSKMFA